jgi:hypothetical protein
LASWLVEERRVKVGIFILLLTPAMVEGCDQANRANVGRDGRLYGGEPDLKTRSRLWVKTHLVSYSRLRDAVRNSGIGADPARGSSAVFDFYTGGDHEAANRERLLAAVGEFGAFASRHGATVQLAYVPLTVEADFAPVKAAAAKGNLELDVEVPFRTCAFVAEKLNLPLHDLRPALRMIQSQGQALNVLGDFHYSAALSRACGLKLWADIRARGRATGATQADKPKS